MKNFVKEKINNNKTVFGTWNTLASEMVSEVMARAGFDFLIIDFEHGPFVLSEIHKFVNACENHNCSPLIRLPGNHNWMIQQALDQGAHGVIIPGIETSQDAKDVVKAAKFVPIGKRGFTPFTKAGKFSDINVENYPEEANNASLVGVIIESLEALSNLDDILMVEGIDLVYFGAYDLSVSLGYPGLVYNQEIISRISSGIRKTIKAKKCPGGFVPQSIEKTKFVIDMGISFVTYNVDSAILYNAIDNFLNQLNKNNK